MATITNLVKLTNDIGLCTKSFQVTGSLESHIIIILSLSLFSVFSNLSLILAFTSISLLSLHFIYVVLSSSVPPFALIFFPNSFL